MIDINFVLNNFYQIPPVDCDNLEKFISSHNSKRRYLFGRNKYSHILSEIFDIEAFVDDFAEPNTFWKGKPVINANFLPDDAIVVNCSMSIHPISVLKRLNSIKVSTILAYADFCRYFLDKKVPLPDFVNQSRKDIYDNLSKWKQTSELLSDSKSKKTLDDLIYYRITGNYSCMKSYSVRFKEQYFESFLNKHNLRIFVDCGGFDGDTTEEFCKRYPNYKKVYLFEPSSTNIAEAKKRLQGFRDIQFIPLGVSDQESKLRFNSEEGSASCVSDSGLYQISVTTLDKNISEKVSFIKMDLEGWELKALQGSIKHIEEDHPILAISVYHHPSDFWRIPEFILNLRNDYQVFLRHYTEGWSESVMYFVPK